MPNTLTISSKQSPYPYAAIVIAAYTKTVDLVFDDSTSGLILAMDGTSVTQEEDIVQALAKEGGMSSDSKKVFYQLGGVILSELAIDILFFHSLENAAFNDGFPRNRVCFTFPG